MTINNKICSIKEFTEDLSLDLDFIREFKIEDLIDDQILPIKNEKNKLYVATYRIIKNETIQKYNELYNLKLIPFYISLSMFQIKFKSIQKKIDILEKKEVCKFKESNIFIEEILDRAIIKRASDVHFEPCKDFSKIRLRIDGVLVDDLNIGNKNYLEILSIIKVKSNMDISKKLIPQDGNMAYYFKGIQYKCRISTIPSIYGEKLVIRLLNPKEEIKLEDLGFNKSIGDLKKILKINNGIFLISGPTGSGKSTTLKALINSMNKNEKNIITIEDPIEYELKNVTQVSLNPKAGLNFSSALKNLLRQDPDVIMVGEIRDEETAQIALRAAVTGHLVLSTVHTFDSTSVITRLLDMGIPPYIILDTVSIVLSQRLVRKICPFCKEECILKDNLYSELGLEKGTKVFRGKGCSHCNNTGYKGRIVTYEVLKLEQNHKNYISRNTDLSGFRDFCIENNLTTLKENVITLLKEGVTTIEEAYKVIL